MRKVILASASSISNVSLAEPQQAAFKRWGHKTSLPTQMSHKLYGILDDCCKYLFSGEKKKGGEGSESTEKVLNIQIIIFYEIIKCFH